MNVSTEDFDAFLVEISDCFIARDIGPWRRRMILPFSIITQDGPVVLKTEQDVAKNFEGYLRACEAMNLDVIDRRPIAIEDCGDGTWLGTYETRLVANGVLATQTYTSTALLRWEDGILKMSSILNGRGHHEWTGLRPGYQGG